MRFHIPLAKVATYISYPVVVVCLMYCGRALAENAGYIANLPKTPLMIPALTGCVLLHLITLFSFGQIWCLLLKGGGVMLPYLRAVTIVGTTQIGKYLPGNVFHYVGRTARGMQIGIAAEVLGISMVIETALVVATTAALSIGGMLLDQRMRELLWRIGSAIPVGRVVFGIIVTVCIGFLLAVNGRARQWLIQRQSYLAVDRIALVIGLYCLNFAIYALVLWLLTYIFWSASPGFSILYFLWRFALAWLAGFVVPGAPAGLGVREAVFTWVFTPELGEGVAVSLALIMRLVSSLGDIMIFACAWILQKYCVGRQ